MTCEPPSNLPLRWTHPATNEALQALASGLGRLAGAGLSTWHDNDEGSGQGRAGIEKKSKTACFHFSTNPLAGRTPRSRLRRDRDLRDGESVRRLERARGPDC